jgi:hypothetical protein
MFKHIALSAAAFALVVSSTTVSVEAKTKSDISFTFPTDKPVKIVVFRPDVEVGTLGTSGLPSPNSEWTQLGRKNLADALRKDQAQFERDVVFLEEMDGEKGKLVADYQSLFRAVSNSILVHKYMGSKLPTKKGKFDWTLGPGVKQIGEIGGGNYALFLYTYDAYGSGGRKAMQIFALFALGSFMPAGVHQSYASLVDLDTGQVVWFNVDLSAGGDPREVLGAEKRIGQLLSTMPGRKAAVAAKAPKK